MDLRAEPLVLCVPEIEKGRYYSVQLIDMYTFNYGYIGSRTTGNDAGNYMIAGPNWKGETPAGIDKVFRCETEFSFAVFRTQLFEPGRHRQREEGPGRLQGPALSAFLKKPAPPAAPEIKWPKIDKKLAEDRPFDLPELPAPVLPAGGPEEKPLRAQVRQDRHREPASRSTSTSSPRSRRRKWRRA